MTRLSLKSTIAFFCLVFASLAGAQTLQTLCYFNFTNGASPYAELTLGNDGNLYSTTANGGSSDFGTVFQVTTNGVLTPLVSFAKTNGAYPLAGLTLGFDGNLYGTTFQGGNTNFGFGYGVGTIFKVTTNGTLTSLASFTDSNGSQPRTALTLGNDQSFFGTTFRRLSGYEGTVFKVTTNGTITSLFLFSQNTNGTAPSSALTLGEDGKLYGSTSGYNPYGTLFSITTNGILKTLVSFNGNNGANPYAALTLGNDHNFYGTTSLGGTSNYGTIFKMSTNGTLTTLVSFHGNNGSQPQAALRLGNDGNFYGTTSKGGVGNFGTVFMVTTNGSLITLVSFMNTNGASPSAALTVGNDGDFYGTTRAGGITNSDYTNGMGSVFRLLLTPLITAQPQSQTNKAGTTVTFAVSATNLISGNLSYQWQKNDTNLVDVGDVFGATTNLLTIQNISSDDEAGYSVIVGNSKGNVTNYAKLTVVEPPVFTAQPTNLVVLPGTNVVFGVALSGSASFFRYQWRFNGANLFDATNAIYTIASISTNHVGNYSVVVTNLAGKVTSSNAALTMVLSPTNQTNYASSMATFTAKTFSPVSLIYRWRKNGTNLVNGGNISGATNSTLTIANLSDADAANYSAVVDDTYASVTTSNATLTVNNSLFIVTQPLSQTIGVGSNVTFSTKAYGAVPLVFQWYYNSSPIGSATSGTNISSYTLTNIQTNQSGSYSVQVFNGSGGLMSSNAILTVKVFPPIIALHPTSQRVMVGSNVLFTVSVNGTPPFTYQWHFNGTNILNATNSTYSLIASGSTNTGNYSVLVTNSGGSVTSSNALLTVIVSPSLGLQLSAGYPLLSLYGVLSSNFVVQYNTNLVNTNWINLRSLTNLSVSPYQFLDPAGGTEPARFYRAFMQ